MIDDYINGIQLLKNVEEEYDRALTAIRAKPRRLVFIGNGGSFQGHMAHDFLKVGDIPTIAPESPSLLTCLHNDYPKDDLFVEWIKRIWQPDDLLIAVSSSGKSQNIIRAIEWVQIYTGAVIITITGFEKENPISKLGTINVWFDTKSYGVHECLAQIFLHSILDDIVKENEQT